MCHRQPPAHLCRGPRRRATGVLRGPTGYRLMLQRQRLGAAMSDPVIVKTGIAMLAEACPEEPPQTWALLRTVLKEGFQSIDDRLQKLGPLAPERFSLQEANMRLNEWAQGWRWRA